VEEVPPEMRIRRCFYRCAQILNWLSFDRAFSTGSMPLADIICIQRQFERRWCRMAIVQCFRVAGGPLELTRVPQGRAEQVFAIDSLVTHPCDLFTSVDEFYRQFPSVTSIFACPPGELASSIQNLGPA
jgi:hypothetical protein